MSFTFKHPKYYTELRKLRNKSDQAISYGTASTDDAGVRPGPGPKRQASSTKLFKILDASFKLQAASVKLQAASDKLPDTFTLIKFYRDRSQGLY